VESELEAEGMELALAEGLALEANAARVEQERHCLRHHHRVLVELCAAWGALERYVVLNSPQQPTRPRHLKLSMPWQCHLRESAASWSLTVWKKVLLEVFLVLLLPPPECGQEDRACSVRGVGSENKGTYV
jgi:hypothetical protein